MPAGYGLVEAWHTAHHTVSVRITKMLMGGLVFASEASEKKIFRPLLGGGGGKS